MIRLGVCVSLAALASCTSSPRSTPGGAGSQGSAAGSAVVPPPAAPLVVTDRASAQASAGKQVEVRGTADDAKLGALITVGTLYVYCLGVDRWPAAVAGKTVAARGLLEHTDEFAEERDPNLPSAGTAGAVWVLRACVFEGPQ